MFLEALSLHALFSLLSTRSLVSVNVGRFRHPTFVAVSVGLRADVQRLFFPFLT